MTSTHHPGGGLAAARAAVEHPPKWSRWAFDGAVVVALTVISYLVRRDGLPVNGLWFDDSWVAAGAIHGRLADIMTVGSGHPAFTALLIAWHDIGSGSIHGLSVPALVLGTIGPAVLYIALRRFGFQRAISALLAAALVVAAIPIVYSGRVKPYTFDPVLILLLGMAIPPLARIRWRWPLVVAWVLVALLLGAFSGYVLLATAAAGIILFLHPASDRLVRGCAVAAQGASQLVFYAWAQRSTDLTGIEDVLRDTYDAQLHLYLNPIRFGSEVLTHLRRIATVYPGGSGVWLSVFSLAAVAGLVLASVKSPRRDELLPARFFLLMFAMAFVGAVVGKFPFGPTVDHIVSTGGRYAMWMAPAIAFGLAAVLQRGGEVLQRVAGDRRQGARRAFDLALLAIALVVILQGAHDGPAYPWPGSASASRYLDGHIRPGDVALVANVYAFADITDLPVTLRPTPSRQVGFTPHIDDARVFNVGAWGEIPFVAKDIDHLTKHASRVLTLTGGPFGPGQAATFAPIMKAAGWHPTVHEFGEFDEVVVWQR